jgi:anthranilate phosphoribosyltransferase
MGRHALLLRGTEGEAVADARRVPQMDGFAGGVRTCLQEAQAGPLVKLPDLPAGIDAGSTAAYIRAVMAGEKPVPPPIALQLEHILRLTEPS